MDRSLGRGGVGWGRMGRAGRPKSQAAGKGTVESGTESKSDRRIKAKKNRWLRGVGEPGEWLWVEQSAKVRPARSLRGRKGRTENGAGKPRPAAKSGGAAHSPLCSPRNTSLNFLSGFPKSPPADMMEPPPPPQSRDLPCRRYFNQLTKRAKGRAGSLGPCRAWRRNKAGGQDCSSQTGSRRRHLPAESPGTELGPRLGKEGGRCRKKPRVPKAGAVRFSEPG